MEYPTLLILLDCTSSFTKIITNGFMIYSQSTIMIMTTMTLTKIGNDDDDDDNVLRSSLLYSVNL